ncbi:tetratricopeptide repeat protein [Roseibacillus persicicus]|uniref:tetratricopeptide repeat protein n=1 Tax=Roseibacillus persicicus TaxID=454148 RepID=UPI00280F3A3F|nr:tetratricopeptide repeat protein [Roseibacillus persicicus]MDQ8190525.1 tetratricopeptide repeat protein [Roseibacillus persicicus]
MDKKLILYLIILAGLVTATVKSVQSSKEVDTTLTTNEIELLEDTGHFDLDPNENVLIPLYEEGTQLSPEELANGEEPSAELAAAYEKFLGTGKKGSPILTFALFIVTGVFTGFLIVSYILPNVVQRASEEVYGSTQKVGGPSALTRAQAAVAQGEWEQAIELYQEAATEEPDNRLPWVEIAMLQRERLENPHAALLTLEQALARGGWRENDEAFFLFRKIEIFENDLNEHDQAITLLRDVIDRFPQTRHSANAMHKLHELGES